jgi:hypothetical protein
MGNNNIQNFGNTPRGSRLFDHTLPKIADQLEILNKRIGETIGIPKHLLEKKAALWSHPSDHIHLDMDGAVRHSAKIAVMLENKRTIGAILAGLRLLQIEMQGPSPCEKIMDIFTNVGEFESLSIGEIDGLCEVLNCL